METLYKKISKTELKNRPETSLSSTDSDKVDSIINLFITKFKDKHLS